MLNLHLLLKAVDEISGPVKQIKASLGGLTGQIDKTAAAGSRLRELGKGISAAGLAVAGTASAAAAALDMEKLPFEAARAEHSLRALGNVADLIPKDLKRVQAEVLSLTKVTNQSQEALLGGLGALLSRGMGLSDGLALIKPIGMAATATQASIDDLSKTLFAGVDNLKIPVSQATAYLDTLAQAGKEGSFELRDMAQFFPSITAKAQALGMAGRQSAAQLGAALQIAMKGAGEPSEAANNLLNFLSKITSPETARNFEKMGINLQAEVKKGWASGDLPGHMVELVSRVTKGDPFKMGALFSDMQVLSFLKPMIANMDEYRRIRDKSMSAAGVVDKDHQSMMGTAIEQWKQLKLQVANIVLPAIQPWLERINYWLTRLNESGSGVKRLVGVIGAGLVGGVALVVLGQFVRLLGGAKDGLDWIRAKGPGAFKATSSSIREAWINLKLLREYSQLKGGLGKGALEMAKDAGGGWGKMAGLFQGGGLAAGLGRLRGLFNFSWALPVLKGVGVALAGISAPVWGVIAVVVAAAALIWRYWKPIANFFSGLWQGLKEGLAPLKPAFTSLGAAFAPILGPLKAVWTWLKALFTPVEATSKSFENGRKMGQGLAVVIGKVAGVLGFLVKTMIAVTGTFWQFLKTGTTIMVWLYTLPVQLFSKINEFRKAGMSIPTAIWEGIKAAANKPIQAIKDMVAKIKGILGFGKSGPVAEVTATTQAVQSVVPAAVAQGAAQATRGAREDFPAMEAGAGGPLALAGAGGGGIHVTYSPSFQIGTAVPGVEDLVMNALKSREHDLMSLIQTAVDKAQARKFQ